MKKVLVIAYYFPPLGMGGVQRVAKFVKYLPHFGWKPIVLTVKDIVYHAHDTALLKEVQQCSIHRTESLDLLRIAKKMKGCIRSLKVSEQQNGRKVYSAVAQKFFNQLLIPDSKILWLPFALSKAKKIIREEHTELIFTSSPPHSIHILGAYLRRKTGIPWIADLRDQWAGNADHQNDLQSRFNRFLERKSLVHADHIITVSQPISQILLNHLKIDRKRVATIPNGFDRADFKKQIPRKSNKFSLLYCGAITSDIHLESFFSGASKAILEWPELKQFMRIQLVGAVTNLNTDKILQKHEIQEVTDIIGYVNHARSIEFLMASDLLILWLPSHMKGGMVTGKIFEYLASGKPILAILPEGVAKQYILKFKRGIVIPSDDVDQIANVIHRAYVMWKRGDLKLSVPRWQGLDIFNRVNQTAVLSDIFNQYIRHGDDLKKQKKVLDI